MRLLPISLLYTLLASMVIADSSEQTLGAAAIPGEILEPEKDADAPQPTIFNGVQVPHLADIDGERFNTVVKDGYWFVKHYS
jgi:protein disulfide-isomerase